MSYLLSAYSLRCLKRVRRMIEVVVKGMKPVTQGSMSAFGPGVLTDTHSKKLKPWR